jgi:hypothetical protein
MFGRAKSSPAKSPQRPGTSYGARPGSAARQRGAATPTPTKQQQQQLRASQDLNLSQQSQVMTFDGLNVDEELAELEGREEEEEEGVISERAIAAADVEARALEEVYAYADDAGRAGTPGGCPWLHGRYLLCHELCLVF